MDWLDGFPRAVVWAHVAMLPRIEAGESLLAVERIAVAVGGGADTIRAWQRVAHVETARVRRATPADLKALGFGYRKVPKR